MNYNFSEDLKSVRTILGISQEELALLLGTEQITVSRSETGKTSPGPALLENFYSLAFSKDINLGKLKEMFWREKLSGDEKLLFHGAKAGIEGNIDISRSRGSNDFGKGFYTGESYEQSISFISNFENSCVYMTEFSPADLSLVKYDVNQEWMMTIAYYRGRLEEYKNHPYIKKLRDKAESCDFIIAPIADNRMFQIINSFVEGEITDIQCRHCLAATNLGYQYVFKSEKAAGRIKLLERCYISRNEKEYYQQKRTKDAKLGEDKVKLARRQYRGKGKYIDEILV